MRLLMLSVLAAVITVPLPLQAQNDVELLGRGWRPEQTTTYLHKQAESASVVQSRVVWRTDTGPYLDRYICYGEALDPIKFDIMINQEVKDLKNVKLTLSVWDVDEAEGEVDKVYVNGVYVGILHGADNSWSINTYTLNPAWLRGGTPANPGRNEIVVDLTVSGWCVTVDWGAISADAQTFSVTSFTPRSGEVNVDFRAPAITATFSEEVDPATANNTTFTVSYFGPTAAMVDVSGSYSTSAKTVTFTPTGTLMDGVKYAVQIKSGKNGMKSKAGLELDKDAKWTFTTTPNVQIEKVVPVQTSEGSDMIALKRGMIRVYATWERKTNVHEKGQADRVQAKVSVESNGIAVGTQTVTIKRKDAITSAERRTGRQSVNFFSWFPPVGGNSLKASVELTHHNGQTTTVEKTQGYTTHSKFVDLRYQYVAMLVGGWRTSPTSIPWGTIHANAHGANRVMMEQFPISSVSSSSGGTFDPGLPKPTRYALITEENYVALRLYQQWQRTLQAGGTQFIVGYYPMGYLGAGVVGGEGFSQWLVSWGGNVVNMVSDAANASILPHEIGHAWTLGHTGSSPTIEGYEIDASGTRGRQRSLSNGNFVTSLMNPMPDDPGAAFITNADYNTLLSTARKGTIQPLERSLAIPVFHIAGFFDPADVVTLDPIRRQEFTNVNPPNTGTYTVEQVGSGGTTIATNNFDPAGPIIGTDGRQYRMFSIPVPYNAGTQRIRIKRGATILREVVRSTNAPSITITSPATGAIWNGTRTISWSATDADGDAMTYDVSYSADNGTTWSVLAMELSTTSLTVNTDLIPPGSNCRLSISASDGFNTTVATVNFTVARGLTVLTTSPLPSATNVPTTTSLSANFASALRSTSIVPANFVVTTGTTTVTGTVSYNALTRTFLFTPTVPLQYGTTYTARVKAGIQDTTGNTLASDYVWSFTTEQDDAPLEVESVTPEGAQIGVAVNSSITIRFSKAVNAATANTSNIRMVAMPLGTAVAGTVTYDATQRAATFRPNASLATDTRYQCTVTTGVLSSDNKPLSQQYEWFFITGSDSLSAVSFTGRFADRGVDKNANGQFDSLAIDVEVHVMTAGRYSMNGRLADRNGTEILWAALHNVQLPLGTSTLTLNFDGKIINAYSMDGPYQLTDLMVYNTANTNIHAWLSQATTTAAYRASQFEQTNIPAAVDFDPPDGATGVPIDVTVSVRFTRPMNPASIDTLSFVLRDFTNAVVPATVRYDSLTRVATLRPNALLRADTLYSVTLSNSIRGVDGARLLKFYSWSFITGSGKAVTTIGDLFTYPNPFPHQSLPSGGMRFTYVLASAGSVKIRVYTIAGDFIVEIPEDRAPARKGYNEVEWDGRNNGNELIASGTYLYVIQYKDADGVEHKAIGKFTARW